MKTARWYIEHQGRRILAATKREAAALAKTIADATGYSITVRPVRGSSKTAARRSVKSNPAAKAKGATRTSTEVRSPTRTSTWADTRGNVTVTGGAGRGATTVNLRRNPDAGSFLPLWNEQEKGRKARLEYLAGTKGRRLAKGLRGRDRGGAVKAHERGALKTAKFEVTAANRKETFKLGRPTRRQAEALADEFRAAGYDVRISEVSP